MPAHLTSKSAPLTVIIADDHEDYREALCMLLELEDDLELAEQTGEWSSLEQAVDRVEPDIVLMDINMPAASGRRDGLEATRQLLKKHPETSILILSMYDDKEYCKSSFAAGAKAYFLKESQITYVIRAMRDLAAGKNIFGRNYCETLTYKGYVVSGSTCTQTLAS